MFGIVRRERIVALLDLLKRQVFRHRLERWVTGNHVIYDRAHRPDVGAASLIEIPILFSLDSSFPAKRKRGDLRLGRQRSRQQLGTDIQTRSHKRTRSGCFLRSITRSRWRLLVIQDLSGTKIRNFNPPLRIEQNVLRLDVPMQDVHIMDVLERVDQLRCVIFDHWVGERAELADK